MSHYLITGGAGFIGAHLTEALIQQGHQVHVVDNLSNGQNINPKAMFHQVDIRDYDAIKPLFKSMDGCFHLAAIPSVVMDLETWFDYHAINLQGSLNVFKACLEADRVPVVYASSCGVYGDNPTLPLHEALHIKPLSGYGCDKYASELNAYLLFHVAQLQSIGLRFFNVYGPGQNPTSPYSGVITRFIEAARHDEPFTIYGDGTQTRDFIYVMDIVNHLQFAMKKITLNAPVINLCTGHAISIRYLAEHIARLFNKTPTFQSLPRRPFDVLHSVGSTEKMTQFGFVNHTSLEEGLAKTLKTLKRD